MSSFSCRLVAGGIAGDVSSFSTISNCYNVGEVTATTLGGSSYYYYSAKSGGIVGNIDYSSVINNCYNTGIVSANAPSSYFLAYATAGGIAGQSSATITNCYNVGTVSTTIAPTHYAYLGGLVGENDSYSSITNCYCLDTIADTVGDDSGTLTNVLALSDTQMKQQASFVGFDFTDIWAINPAINDGYPYLRGMQP